MRFKPLALILAGAALLAAGCAPPSVPTEVATLTVESAVEECTGCVAVFGVAGELLLLRRREVEDGAEFRIHWAGRADGGLIGRMLVKKRPAEKILIVQRQLTKIGPRRYVFPVVIGISEVVLLEFSLDGGLRVARRGVSGWFPSVCFLPSTKEIVVAGGRGMTVIQGDGKAQEERLPYDVEGALCLDDAVIVVGRDHDEVHGYPETPSWYRQPPLALRAAVTTSDAIYVVGQTRFPWLRGHALGVLSLRSRRQWKLFSLVPDAGSSMTVAGSTAVLWEQGAGPPCLVLANGGTVKRARLPASPTLSNPGWSDSEEFLPVRERDSIHIVDLRQLNPPGGTTPAN